MDWFAREGWIFFSWWLLVTVAGLTVWPLSVRVLGALPDRGYTLLRPLGMLLIGFVFWLLASFGFLPNTTESMVLAWFLVLIGALFVYMRQRDADFNWRNYLRDNRWTIIATEVIFFALFLGWTVYRAYQNDTFSTEKPMEIMFISSIMRSEAFPPNDGWMAGYSISYYYFGYVLSAMLSMLSGISSGFGFSMTSSLWFALTGLTAFGVTANLVRSQVKSTQSWVQMQAAPLITGVLALIFVIFLSNFQTSLIEMPYQSRLASPEYLDFWGTPERNSLESLGYAPAEEAGLLPFTEWSRDWWWFRASRVIRETQLDGSPVPNWFAQPISEFPNFSFLLSDNHPHVLALPFVLLTIGLALNLVLTMRHPNRYELLIYGLAIGGLIFLNTWDGPIYLTVLVGADALRRLLRNGGVLRLNDWLWLVGLGLALVIIALFAYLPFFVGFRSQASGLIPNPLYPTYFPQLFIQFGPFILLGLAFLGVEVWRGGRRMNWSLGLTVAGALLLFLALAMIVFLLIGAVMGNGTLIAQRFVDELGGWNQALPLFLLRRILGAPTALLLLGALVVVVGRLFPRMWRASEISDDAPDASLITYSPATGLSLLLIAAAAGLILLPEFIYLRDNFGTRINTVFKFYYQAWVMLSIGCAYGFYTIMSSISERRPALALRVAYGVMLGVILTMGLIYPIAGIYARAYVDTGRIYATEPVALTLDGTSRSIPRDYYDAVMCLGELVQGDDAIVVEGVRDAYNSPYGRVAAFTGIPILLGWEGHENQWRGSTYPEIAGSRRPDIDKLYSDLPWELVIDVVNKYGVDYIVFGPTERSQYGVLAEEKFDENLDVVCEYGDARVYAVDDQALTVSQTR